MSGSKTKLKPVIERIIIKDKEDPTVLSVEVKGTSDPDKLLIASAVLGNAQSLGFQMTCDIILDTKLFKAMVPDAKMHPMQKTKESH